MLVMTFKMSPKLTLLTSPKTLPKLIFRSCKCRTNWRF